jgi:cobalt-zinc-cadmium efflux system outer membrane protein
MGSPVKTGGWGYSAVLILSATTGCTVHYHQHFAIEPRAEASDGRVTVGLYPGIPVPATSAAVSAAHTSETDTRRGPRTSEHRTTEPRTGGQRVAEPRTSEYRTSEYRTSEPRTSEHRTTERQTTGHLTPEWVAVTHRDDEAAKGRNGAAGAKNGASGESLPTPRPLTPGGPTADTGGTELTLDQVINTTLLADPQLRAGFEAINQAYGDALTASLRPNPTFNINQTLLPLTRPFTVDRQGGPPQLDIGLAYPIDWFLFGKRAAAMQAATLGVRVSESEFADLVRQRVLQAATAYYDVLEAKALLDLARQDVDNLKQVESVAQKSVEAGNRPAVELNRVRLDRLQSEQALRNAENALVNAKARLQVLLGRGDAVPAFEVAGSLDSVPQLEPLPLDEAYAIALQNRPDLAALRWKVSRAQADLLVERRKAYPEVTPQVGYTRQFQEKAIGFPDASSFGFGFDMTLPLSDRNQGNRRKAASVLAQSRAELRAGELELRAEVTQADQNLRTAAANARAIAGEQLRIAGEVRDTINRSYAAGIRPLLDVLDAQRNYRETYRLYITSRAELGRAVMNYSATLGKKVTP